MVHISIIWIRNAYIHRLYVYNNEWNYCDRQRVDSECGIRWWICVSFSYFVRIFVHIRNSLITELWDNHMTTRMRKIYKTKNKTKNHKQKVFNSSSLVANPCCHQNLSFMFGKMRRPIRCWKFIFIGIRFYFSYYIFCHSFLNMVRGISWKVGCAVVLVAVCSRPLCVFLSIAIFIWWIFFSTRIIKITLVCIRFQGA